MLKLATFWAYNPLVGPVCVRSLVFRSGPDSQYIRREATSLARPHPLWRPEWGADPGTIKGFDPETN